MLARSQEPCSSNAFTEPAGPEGSQHLLKDANHSSSHFSRGREGTLRMSDLSYQFQNPFKQKKFKNLHQRGSQFSRKQLSWCKNQLIQAWRKIFKSCWMSPSWSLHEKHKLGIPLWLRCLCMVATVRRRSRMETREVRQNSATVLLSPWADTVSPLRHILV